MVGQNCAVWIWTVWSIPKWRHLTCCIGAGHQLRCAFPYVPRSGSWRVQQSQLPRRFHYITSLITPLAAPCRGTAPCRRYGGHRVITLRNIGRSGVSELNGDALIVEASSSRQQSKRLSRLKIVTRPCRWIPNTHRLRLLTRICLRR